LAQEVKSAFPQAETPIFAVLNGIDAQRVREDAAAGRSAAALQPYVVNLATLEPKKGQDLLIKAFAKLPAAFSDFRLVIAGFDAGSGPALRALAAELGVAERVHLLGDLSRPDALAVCRGGTLFVLSSRAEPFGLVVLEAAVLGVPVVAHRVGGVPEIVAGSEFGTLVEVGAVDDLAAAIASLLGDAGRRRQLSSALRGRVEREFTWANSFAQLMAVAQGGTGQSQR
jgi:glycosyltransferase involved in cell wall biosynthesis